MAHSRGRRPPTTDVAHGFRGWGISSGTEPHIGVRSSKEMRRLEIVSSGRISLPRSAGPQGENGHPGVARLNQNCTSICAAPKNPILVERRSDREAQVERERAEPVRAAVVLIVEGGDRRGRVLDAALD